MQPDQELIGREKACRRFNFKTVIAITIFPIDISLLNFVQKAQKGMSLQTLAILDFMSNFQVTNCKFPLFKEQCALTN